MLTELEYHCNIVSMKQYTSPKQYNVQLHLRFNTQKVVCIKLHYGKET